MAELKQPNTVYEHCSAPFEASFAATAQVGSRSAQLQASCCLHFQTIIQIGNRPQQRCSLLRRTPWRPPSWPSCPWGSHTRSSPSRPRSAATRRATVTPSGLCSSAQVLTGCYEVCASQHRRQRNELAQRSADVQALCAAGTFKQPCTFLLQEESIVRGVALSAGRRAVRHVRGGALQLHDAHPGQRLRRPRRHERVRWHPVSPDSGRPHP